MADITADGMEFRVGRVLAQTFSVYFGNIVPFLMLALVISSPTYIYRVLAGPPTLGDTGDYVQLFWYTGAEYLILFVVNFLLGQLITAALVFGTFQELKGENVSLGDCFSKGIGLMFPVFGIATAYLLIVLVVALLTFIPGSYFVTYISDATGSVILSLAALAICASPTIYLWIMLWVTIPVAVIERRGLGSFSRSAKMTKGFRWRLFLLLVLLAVMGLVIAMVAGAAGGILAMTSPNQFAGGVATEWLLTGLMTALSAVIATVTYHDLRVAKEGVDTNQIAAVFD